MCSFFIKLNLHHYMAIISFIKKIVSTPLEKRQLTQTHDFLCQTCIFLLN